MKHSNQRHDEIEEMILQAADRLLARGGYQQLTMDDLAHEAGLTKGVLYLHFQSKTDVLIGHLDRLGAQVLAGLQRIAASSAPPAEKFREMILLRVMHRFDTVQPYPEAVAHAIHDLGPSLLQRREYHFAAEAKVFAAVLEEAEDVMAVPANERNAVANAVIAATNALLPYNLTPAELGRRREIAEKAERIATMLLRGVLRPERGRKRRAA